MEEGKEQIEGLEPEDHAVRLPADPAGILDDLGGGQGLGERGEEDPSN